MARRKKAPEGAKAEITVWPSSFPDDVGSIAPASGELSLDCDEMGSRFLSDAVEQSFSGPTSWESQFEEEPYFDAQMGDALLRSFGLKPMPKRTTTRPLPSSRKPLPKLSAPRMPLDLEEFITPDDELDMTEESIREVSLLDHEGEEAGSVESPNLRTDDVHTHGKRRGGHARTSIPPRFRRG